MVTEVVFVLVAAWVVVLSVALVAVLAVEELPSV